MTGGITGESVGRVVAFVVLAAAVTFTLVVAGSFVGLPPIALCAIAALGLVGAAVLVFRGRGARATEADTEKSGRSLQ